MTNQNAIDYIREVMIDLDLCFDEMKYMPPMPMVTAKRPNTRVVIISTASPNLSSRFKELLDLYMAEPQVVPLSKELEWLRDGATKFEIKVKESDTVTHCPDCGYHVNINSADGTGYCPLCDKIVRPN